MRIKNIHVSDEDIEKIYRMFGRKGSYVIGQLLEAISRLDEEQYSHYSSQEAYVFCQMFHYFGGQL